MLGRPVTVVEKKVWDGRRQSISRSLKFAEKKFGESHHNQQKEKNNPIKLFVARKKKNGNGN